MKTAQCAALLISAIASGQGKTTATAALARRAVRRGLRVSVFKAGPDFIDPTILQRASGRPVYQLDLWMGGLAHCQALLYAAALSSDLILIEGMMGLYDGSPSTADLGRQFGVPVGAVIDGSAMAQTFGALALGLRDYQGAPRIAGIIANRVDSIGHARLLAGSLPRDLPLLATLPQDAAHALPERHLGLYQASEIDDLDIRIEAAADALTDHAPLATVMPTTFPAPPPGETILALLRDYRIGIARDAAFSFTYPANLDTLKTLGATIVPFSPLRDRALPNVDGIYLPGGYPELHAEVFGANLAMHEALRVHYAAGKPIVAECGGMMTLMSALVDMSGKRHRMAGLLQGETRMQRSVQAIAPQAIDTAYGEIRGHTFHHSMVVTTVIPSKEARNPLGNSGEKVFIDKALFASYVHLYFPSNPRAIAALFRP